MSFVAKIIQDHALKKYEALMIAWDSFALEMQKLPGEVRTAIMGALLAEQGKQEEAVSKPSYPVQEILKHQKPTVPDMSGGAAPRAADIPIQQTRFTSKDVVRIQNIDTREWQDCFVVGSFSGFIKLVPTLTLNPEENFVVVREEAIHPDDRAKARAAVERLSSMGRQAALGRTDDSPLPGDYRGGQ